MFVLSGTLVRRFRDRVTRPVVTSLLLLAISASLVATGLSSLVDLKGADFGTPIVSVAVAIAISVALLFLAEAFIPRLPRLIQTGFTQLAQVSLMVILTHSAVLWLMRTPPPGSTVPPFGLTVSFLVALVVPWMAALVIARTPLSAFLIGIPQIPFPHARSAQHR
ncbi:MULTISPECIES: hypothetical protein [unclassified Cryobacterium]|uniref:hypothetical protein n=1 Tax=unclassified Cryobacterium TaxID=2649013 RepID=UPI002AB57FA0|nr:MULTISPECIES: hypothetical protein [unclassified Cryobacterium]MDY7542559.1 hypothetical protein [Cryobacterium sp. 5B3]MEB0264680.1 hypothetical protein [Cryobacterium sp. 10I5]MEB0275162.1 hypothetical protein [Cryobacterium sp. 5B3]